SISAQPSACSVPPSIWPRTIVGLIALPTSTAWTHRRIAISQVSRSTSTSTRHAAQPYTGYAEPVYVSSFQWMPGGGSYVTVSASPRPVASTYARAISTSEPRRACSAAHASSLRRRPVAARSTTPPTTIAVRLATVGPLSGTRAVDGSTTATCAESTPSAPA